MQKLLSKIQHKTFEPGEFIEEKQRTKDEVFALIENMPWEKDREHVQISITTTSITVQTDTNFLKLALYYNGRFVLYFFDGKDLFSKSFGAFADAYADISHYFETSAVELTTFKRENLLFKHVAQHFISKSFVYTVSRQRMKDFLRETTLMGFVFIIIMLAITIFMPTLASFIFGLFMLAFMFVFGGGLNLVIFYNYRRYMQNKTLTLSKGQDIFWYGDINSPKQYNKKDIEKIVIVSTSDKYNSRRMFIGFDIYKIHFNNGIYPIVFNSLLISEGDFCNKFDTSIQENERNAFPLMNDLDME